MSTGANCRMVQESNGSWFYELQRWPYGECPDYDKFGPFPTLDAADTHLSENHANPGGYSIRYNPACCDHSETRDLAAFEITSLANHGDFGKTRRCTRCGLAL